MGALVAALAVIVVKAHAFVLIVEVILIAILLNAGTYAIRSTEIDLRADSTTRYRNAQLVEELPSGYAINSAAFPNCSRKTLEQKGPAGCPAGSFVATGKALFSAGERKHFAVKLLGIDSWASVVELYATGNKEFLPRPVILDVKVAGPIAPDAGPAMTIPIGRIQPAPEFRRGTTITDFKWTLGATRQDGGQTINYLVPPKSCSGKLSFRSTLVIGQKRVADSADAPCP